MTESAREGSRREHPPETAETPETPDTQAPEEPPGNDEEAARNSTPASSGRSRRRRRKRKRRHERFRVPAVVILFLGPLAGWVVAETLGAILGFVIGVVAWRSRV